MYVISKGCVNNTFIQYTLYNRYDYRKPSHNYFLYREMLIHSVSDFSKSFHKLCYVTCLISHLMSYFLFYIILHVHMKVCHSRLCIKLQLSIYMMHVYYIFVVIVRCIEMKIVLIFLRLLKQRQNAVFQLNFHLRTIF